MARVENRIVFQHVDASEQGVERVEGSLQTPLNRIKRSGHAQTMCLGQGRRNVPGSSVNQASRLEGLTLRHKGKSGVGNDGGGRRRQKEG
jgi:hypothetical protein